VELIPLPEACTNALEFLSSTEKRMLDQVGNKRREAWIASRIAIKRLGHRRVPTAQPDTIVTCRLADGPPCCIFPDGRSLPVSDAHDDFYVIAAISGAGTRVGVDVEPVSLDCARVIRRFFPTRPGDPLSATRLWTACEAVAKCTRIELLRVLKEARITSETEKQMVLELSGKGSFWVLQTVFANRVLSATRGGTCLLPA
jgi:phosphopantetheinyl transferase